MALLEVNQEAAGICLSSDASVDFGALLCADCSARAEPKLNPADHTRTISVEQQHFWTNCALLLKVFPEKKKIKPSFAELTPWQCDSGTLLAAPAF